MTSMKNRGRYQSFEVTNSSVVGVFGWTFYGLLLTALVSFGLFLLAANEIIPVDSYLAIVGVSSVIYVIFSFIATFIMASTRSKVTAIIVYTLYTVLLGLVLSSIFVTVGIVDVFYALGVTSLIFGVMALYGYFTKNDLTRFGSIMFMLLFGGLLMTLVNWLIGSEQIYWIASYIILFAMIGYVAYDVKLIKNAAEQGALSHSLPIFLAFNLFIDFISIFLRVLLLIARNRD